MKRFAMREIREALAWSAAGHQALHLHRIIVDRRKAPACFKAAVARGEDIAHLFDRDAGRLERTVRALGVRVVLIEDRDGPGQHVDLCGAPLRRALALCGNETEELSFGD